MTDAQGFGNGDTSFRAAGGYEGLIRLCERFYFYMDTLPEAKKIRAMRTSELKESIEKLARLLSGWLGGPELYREKYGPFSMVKVHSQFSIGVKERDAWLLCMQRALDDQPYTEGFKKFLLKKLYRPADVCRNIDH